MDLGEIFDYIFERFKDTRPVTVNVGDQVYAVTDDGTLGNAVRELAPQWDDPTLEVSTLSGLVAAVKAKLDGMDPTTVALRVVDHLTAEVVSIAADKYGKRHVWVRATHKPETKFVFDKYYTSSEEFIIALRAAFYLNGDTMKVQRLCSSLSSGDSVVVVDDGLCQTVTVNAGAVTRATVEIPSDGVALVPWRTFRDANPVESKFLLRLKSVKDALPHIALFEIDAKWRVDTMQSIANYLQTNLPDVAIIA